jgi:hypothetical protein
MDKIMKVSGWLKKVFEFLVLLPIPVSVLLWMFAKFPERTLFGLPLLGGPIGFSGFSNSAIPILGDITPWLRLSGFMVSLPMTCLQVFWIWQLRQLFKNYSHGRIFTVQNTICIRRTAMIFLVMPIGSILLDSALTVILTANNPVGHRMLGVSIGTSQISDFLTGLVLVVIAWIMNEAQRIKEEADLTV